MGRGELRLLWVYATTPFVAVAVLVALALCAPVQAQTPEIDALRAAAEAGVAEAQYDLVFRYTFGRGVPQDNAEAVRWYRLAADQGLAIYWANSSLAEGVLLVMPSR